jgi:hypothetical protein
MGWIRGVFRGICGDRWGQSSGDGEMDVVCFVPRHRLGRETAAGELLKSKIVRPRGWRILFFAGPRYWI